VTNAIARALATAVLGALLGAAFMAFCYILNPGLEIDFDTDPPRLLEGVFPPERDPGTGTTFAWTGPELRLGIAGLDRSVEWVLDARIRGARADASQNPILSFFADDALLATRPSSTDFEDIRITIPASPEQRRGVLIEVRSSGTFVPGARDPRALGAMIDRLSLKPSGVALPPRRAFAAASLSAALLGAAVALLGVTAGSAVGAAVLLSAAAGSMLSRGFGPYTDYPLAAVRAAAWIGLLLTLIGATVESRRRQPLRNTARFVAAFSAGALFLKLLVLLHPDMPLDVTPLRVVALSVNTIAAALLYGLIVNRWGDRIAAAIAVAIYHLLPLDFRIMTVGNLTNAFAQSLSVVVLALMGSGWMRWERPAAVVLLTMVLSAAFLWHLNTFAMLFVTCVVAAVLFVRKGGPSLTSSAQAVFAAAAAALLLSALWYDGHLIAVYRSEVARIGAENGGAFDAAGGIGARLRRVPLYLHKDVGIPALILAGAGVWQMRRRYSRDRLTLSIWGWAVSCGLFLALAVLAPMDVRCDVAAMPAVAVAGATGAAALWMERRAIRVAGVVLLFWIVWIGVRTWWTVLP
jgi:hypothetical protein